MTPATPTYTHVHLPQQLLELKPDPETGRVDGQCQIVADLA